MENKTYSKKNINVKIGTAAATLFTAGIITGAAHVNAYADTPDQPAGQPTAEGCVAEDNAPAGTAEADVKKAEEQAESARTGAAEAEKAVSEAAGKVADAESSYKEAAENTAAAEQKAEDAISRAQEEAKAEDAAAGQKLQDSMRAKDTAEANRESAREAAGQAADEQASAEQELADAKSRTSVTVEDISGKRAEADAAEESLEAARSASEEAGSAAKEAQKKADDAEADRARAEDAVQKASQEVCDSEKRHEDAAKAEVKAEEDLNRAAGLKDGSISVEETEEYRATGTAKVDMEKAQAAADAAAAEAAQAKDALTKAQAAFADRQAELAAAESEQKAAAADLTSAEVAKVEAEETAKKAQEAVDNASERVTSAEDAVQAAKEAVEKAQRELNTAVENSRKAGEEVSAAEKSLESAKQEAEAEKEAAISAAAQETAARKAEVEKAKAAFENVDKNYSQGSLGFINWMLSKTDLTESEKRDLESARKILEEGMDDVYTNWNGGKDVAVDSSRNGKVVVPADEKDASSLKNVRLSIQLLKKINELRRTDDNFTGEMACGDAYTSFYFMANAEYNTMLGGVLGRHCRYLSTQNLAFGLQDPTYGWYNEEKAYFDRIRDELGIKKLNHDSLKKIEATAEERGREIGHYTSLFYGTGTDQVMGAAHTDYSYYPYPHGSWGYDASKAHYYTDSSRPGRLYTIDEFEKLFNAYCATLDKGTTQRALAQASQELQKAESRQAALASSDYETPALTEAGSRLEEAQNRYKQAEEQATAARNRLSACTESRNAAGTNLEQAETEFGEAKKARDSALEEAAKAQAALEKASAKAEAALKGVETARAAEAQASADVKTAGSLAEASQKTLEDRKKEVSEASGVYESAKAALDSLTSDKAISRLQANVTEARRVVERTAEDMQTKQTALETAREDLKKAEEALAAAASEKDTADRKNREAADALTAAEQAADRARAELESVQEAYMPVQKALDRAAAAEANSERAAEALREACDAVTAAENALKQAQENKLAAAGRLARVGNLTLYDALQAGMDDPDLAGLVGYVQAVADARTAQETAEQELAAARAELSRKEEASTAAQKVYAAALADLIYTQDRAAREAAGKTEAMGTITATAAVRVDPKDAVTAAASGKKTGSADVSKVSTAIAAPAGRTVPADGSGKGLAGTVTTGDRSDIASPLAGFLLGTGLLAAFVSRKKKHADRACIRLTDKTGGDD